MSSFFKKLKCIFGFHDYEILYKRTKVNGLSIRFLTCKNCNLNRLKKEIKKLEGKEGVERGYIRFKSSGGYVSFKPVKYRSKLRKDVKK